MRSIAVLVLVLWIDVTLAKEQYTAEEQRAINQLRDLAKDTLYEDYMSTDTYLVSWLRAREFDVYGANQMLQRNLKWRKQENIDNLPNEPFPELEKQFLVQFSTDKDGRPVLLLDWRSWNIRIVAAKGQASMEQLKRYMTKLYLEVPSQMARAGNNKHNGQFIVLADLAGWDIEKHACPRCLQVYIHCIQTLSNYYPQGAEQLISINTPASFKPVQTIVRPFQSAYTTSSLHHFDNNKKEWKPYLDKIIPSQNLPAQFGGVQQAPVRVPENKPKDLGCGKYKIPQAWCNYNFGAQ